MRTKEVTKMEKNKPTGAKALLKDCLIHVAAGVIASILTDIIFSLIFEDKEDDCEEEF